MAKFHDNISYILLSKYRKFEAISIIFDEMRAS